MCEYIWCIVVFNHSFNNIIRVSTHTTRKKAPFTTRVVLFIWRARLCWTKYNSKGALWASHVSLWLNTHIDLYHLRCIYICCRWTEFVNSLSFVHVAKFKPIVLYGVYSLLKIRNWWGRETRDEWTDYHSHRHHHHHNNNNNNDDDDDDDDDDPPVEYIGGHMRT